MRRRIRVGKSEGNTLFARYRMVIWRWQPGDAQMRDSVTHGQMRSRVRAPTADADGKRNCLID
jgi:hypothetical protein